MRQVEDTYWWYQVLRMEVVKDVVSRFPADKPCKLLDAGCGTGGIHTLQNSSRVAGHGT